MPWKFNPFSGTLDQTGAGGGGASYIDGEVATYNDLPLDGTAAADSAWLVRSASGSWLTGRRPAGIYIRTATAGVSRDADYTYAGIFPDVFSDANFTLYDDGDTSRNLKFQLSSISANTTRTLTAPNTSGTIALTSDIPTTFDASAITSGVFDNSRINFAAPAAIGGTTAAAGAFTTLSASSTVSGTGFSNYLASPPAIGGTSAAAGSFTTLSASTSLTLGTSGILSGGTNTIEQRNTTSAQTFRIYNTVSGTADANYERGFMRWSSNVLQIGTEKAGTGSARGLELLTDGVAKITISSAGIVQLRSNDPSNGHITNVDSNTWKYEANGLTLKFGRDYGRSQSFFSADEFVFGTYSNVSVSQTGHVVLTRDADNTLAQRNSTNGQTFRIYNTWTNSTTFDRVNLRWASNEFIIDAEAGSGGGTLRGIKIGSATSSLLGFYGVTPVDQPATVADPAGGGTIDTEARTAINDIIDRLQELGLIA